ncbi:hypothetical protein [Actinacidiphila oryziradicis]|uniref:Uncharacterized protein n=1 Tax=Actinacidiphila oryziradicis TaxID=2571141 RepID=A0A4U0RXW7_9ACTN|nr:hypothetical protein [Actinacidiphila oryziradicis]TJZ93194.1 hypothetical protein FCI23_54605 [Actinacidiphila oryziradicis]
MAITIVGAAAQLSARPYAAGDQDTVLALVGDRLPGQPEATPAMLAEALAGRPPVDGSWWAELDNILTDVVHDPSGQVRSCTTRPARYGVSSPTPHAPGTGQPDWSCGCTPRRKTKQSPRSWSATRSTSSGRARFCNSRRTA